LIRAIEEDTDTGLQPEHARHVIEILCAVPEAVKEKKKDKKPNAVAKFFSGIVKYLKDIRSESKKVIWPTRKQTMNNTLIVLIMIFIVGAVVWAIDWVLQQGYMFIIRI